MLKRALLKIQTNIIIEAKSGNKYFKILNMLTLKGILIKPKKINLIFRVVKKIKQ